MAWYAKEQTLYRNRMCKVDSKCVSVTIFNGIFSVDVIAIALCYFCCCWYVSCCCGCCCCCAVEIVELITFPASFHYCFSFIFTFSFVSFYLQYVGFAFLASIVRRNNTYLFLLCFIVVWFASASHISLINCIDSLHRIECSGCSLDSCGNSIKGDNLRN